MSVSCLMTDGLRTFQNNDREDFSGKIKYDEANKNVFRSFVFARHFFGKFLFRTKHFADTASDTADTESNAVCADNSADNAVCAEFANFADQHRSGTANDVSAGFDL